MEHQKSRLTKKKFRIGDLAEELNLKKFVIRFWEKEFGLSSDRSQGGQRFYTEKELELFRLIKNLLYTQGYTIAGARLQLKQIVEEGFPERISGAKAPVVSLSADDSAGSIEPATKTDSSSFEPTESALDTAAHEEASRYRTEMAHIREKLNDLKEKL